MFSLTSCGSSLLNLTTKLPRVPGPSPASLPCFGQAGSGLGAPARSLLGLGGVWSLGLSPWG